jgi:putative ABC transport system permease protein
VTGKLVFENLKHKPMRSLLSILLIIELPLIVNGVDLERFKQMSGGLGFIAGGDFQGPNDVIIDRFYADQKKKKLGDSIDMLGRTWHISGIIEGGKLSHILVQLKELQDMENATGKVSQFYIKLDNPANTSAVIEQLKEKLPDYPIMSMEELASQLRESVNSQGLSAFIVVIMAIGVIIGFAVVCLSMYMAVLQRTREVGILKSLGASKGYILRMILAEALLLGLGGTVLGILMSYGARWAIETFQPASFQMEIVYAWWPRALFITLAAATFGALYPGLTAASHDPIEALAYE